MSKKKIQVKTGERYNRLVIIKEVEPYISPNGSKKNRKFLCKCDCGNEVNVILDCLRRGDTGSCGCLNKERIRLAHKKHGLSKHQLYKAWVDMMHRCYNKKLPHYKNYGGRGIKVCQEWHDPSNYISFCESQKNYNKYNHTLDRIDNNGDYTPINCMYRSRHHQSANQRMPNANTSGFIGVNFRKDKNKWRSYISINGKQNNLGHFSNPIDAAVVRNKYIIENKLYEYGLQPIPEKWVGKIINKVA